MSNQNVKSLIQKSATIPQQKIVAKTPASTKNQNTNRSNVGQIRKPFSTTLTEKVDVAALNYIIHHPELIASISPQKRARLRQYRNGLGIDGKFTVTYEQAQYGKGRVYAKEKLSLQKFPRIVRHTLARDTYFDIDIKNCNPTLLLQLCKQKGWHCATLKDYVDHRDLRLQHVMEEFQTTKEIAKDLFLRLMNGGSFANWLLEYDMPASAKNLPAFVAQFQKEMEKIRDCVWNDRQFQDFVNIAKAKADNEPQKFNNEKSACISILLNDIEHHIVMEIAKFFNQCKPKIVVGVFVFDGLMIEKENLTIEALESALRNCEHHLRTSDRAKFHGLNWSIELVVKPMNEGIELPPEYVHQQYILQGLGEHGEVYWAQYLYPIIGRDVRVHGAKVPLFFSFDKERALWVESDAAGYVSQLIHQEVTPLLETERSDLLQLLSEESSKNDPILKRDLTKTETAISRSTDANFLSRVAVQLGPLGSFIDNPAMTFNCKHPELLSFQNGVVDIRTLQLLPRAREHLFTYSIPYCIKQAQLDLIKQNMPLTSDLGIDNRKNLAPDDPEFFNQLYRFDVFRNRDGVADFLQAYIGYSITGFVEQQVLLWVYGQGSNGKSVLIDAPLRAFGDPLYHSMNYEALCSNDKNNDEVYNARFARVVSINETDGKTINMKVLKSLTSGVDTISVAAKYKGVLKFTPALKLMILSNNNPKDLLGPDAKLAEKRRIIALKMKMCYLNRNITADEAEAQKLESKGKQGYIAEKDPSLEESLRLRSIGFVLWALQGAYRYYNEFRKTLPIPDEVSAHMKKVLVDKQVPPEKFFLDNFDVSPEELDKDMWISAADLHKQYLDYEKGMVQKSISVTDFSRRIAKAAVAWQEKRGIQQPEGILSARIHWNGSRQTVYKNVSAKETK